MKDGDEKSKGTKLQHTLLNILDINSRIREDNVNLIKKFNINKIDITRCFYILLIQLFDFQKKTSFYRNFDVI